jgi:hypothetical protein
MDREIMKLTKAEIDQLPPQYQKQLRDQVAGQASNVEPDSWNESSQTISVQKGIARPGQRVRLHILSRLKRLRDADGTSAKWAIDGIVASGLLPDDSPEYIESVTYSQEKSEKEETIITLSAV